ncbi:exported hypothetical protein [Candidatus Competibacter denitrificans Run_A_D11]|uniref:LPS-assembly lipoprotein LptE n=1 Tax=Candidatus Competibacter denitrificans Run_A_D11 TaxID=1400863 RepID=W6ME07_9GAMM|nr:LPS assembly lipoprotein LptE [Candidatus Competibacter denitrificans]CDI03783.1 exported hypothetical protein [Candidatus Competibacter denitrificans Run_A_D11]
MSRFMAVALTVTVLLVVGCGFHLRGQVEWPPELRAIYVQSQQGIGMPPGALNRKLRLALAGSGVTITPDPTQATAILTILNEGSGRRTVAADRLDIKREHFVAYSAAYELKLVNGKVLIPTEGISANRMLLFDENRVLGFENAQESMVDTMVDDLAWQIVRRLQAVKP